MFLNKNFNQNNTILAQSDLMTNPSKVLRTVLGMKKNFLALVGKVLVLIVLSV